MLGALLGRRQRARQLSADPLGGGMLSQGVPRVTRWLAIMACVVAIAGCTGLGQEVFVGASGVSCSPVTDQELAAALKQLDQVAALFQFESRNPSTFGDNRLAFYGRYLGIFQKPRQDLRGNRADVIMGADLSEDRCTFHVGFVDESHSGETEFSIALREAIVAALTDAVPHREVRIDAWDKVLF